MRRRAIRWGKKMSGKGFKKKSRLDKNGISLYLLAFIAARRRAKARTECISWELSSLIYLYYYNMRL
jgi:hypothetical protein